MIIDEEHLMPAKRELTMRQIRQILRLVRDGVSAREIGRMLGVARSTVQDNLRRAEAAGLANGSLSRYSPRKQTGWKRPILANSGPFYTGHRRLIDSPPIGPFSATPIDSTGAVRKPSV